MSILYLLFAIIGPRKATQAEPPQARTYLAASLSSRTLLSKTLTTQFCLDFHNAGQAAEPHPCRGSSYRHLDNVSLVCICSKAWNPRRLKQTHIDIQFLGPPSIATFPDPGLSFLIDALTRFDSMNAIFTTAF